MKITAIQQSVYHQNFNIKRYPNTVKNTDSEIPQPPINPVGANISFGLSEASKLRILFAYKLPCMYTGHKMIDPVKIDKLMKTGALRQQAHKVIKILEKYEDCMVPDENETIVYKMIKEHSEVKPKFNFRQILESVAPDFKNELKKEQKPILVEMTKISKDLPEDERQAFADLMAQTYNQINEKPVKIPFSTTEFKYKLYKIRDDIKKKQEAKMNFAIDDLIKEASRLPAKLSSKTVEELKKIIYIMQSMTHSSVLSEYAPLNRLLENSALRLRDEAILIPFKRKAFIYDVCALLSQSKDPVTAQKLINKARSLPTSSDSLAAYVVKFAQEPSEKIAYRILWPSFASVEHIKPKSKGGENKMKNYGGARARENSNRQNKDLDIWIQKKSIQTVRANCQRYIDKLACLMRKGVFDKYNIPKTYINDFKRAVEKESKDTIKLDTSQIDTTKRYLFQ